MGFRLSTLLTICWRAGCPVMLARICARICASCQKKGIYSASSDICFTRNPFLLEQCFTLILRHTCLRTALKRQTNKKNVESITREGKHNDSQHKGTIHRSMENSFRIKMMGISEENCRCSGYMDNLMADAVTKG